MNLLIKGPASAGQVDSLRTFPDRLWVGLVELGSWILAAAPRYSIRASDSVYGYPVPLHIPQDAIVPI